MKEKKSTYGEKAAKKYGIVNNLYPKDLPKPIKSFLNTKSYSNRYGMYEILIKDSTDYSAWYVDYICHSYFGTKTTLDNMWTTAVYNRYGGLKAQREYFEYISSPITSPWRDLLTHKDFNYSITRDEKGWITGIIVHTNNFNRYVLMHFLKAYRQVLEGSKFEYFYSQVLAGKNPKHIYESFLIDCYIIGSPTAYHFLFTHEHRAFKLALNHNVINRKIIAKLKRDKFSTNPRYTSTSPNHSTTNMGTISFGMPRLRGLADSATKLVNNRQSGGFLFRDNNRTINTFLSKDIEKVHTKIYKFLQNKKG